MAKTPNRPRDLARLAKLVADIATGQAQDEEQTPTQKRAAKGGAARAKKLPAKKRAAIAKKAARKRWGTD